MPLIRPPGQRGANVSPIVVPGTAAKQQAANLPRPYRTGSATNRLSPFGWSTSNSADLRPSSTSLSRRFCRSATFAIDRAEHPVARRVLDRLEHFEADASERVADDTNVIEGIGQRADARLVILVVDHKRDALFCMCRSGNQRQQQRPKNCGTKSHSPHTLTRSCLPRYACNLWWQLRGPDGRLRRRLSRALSVWTNATCRR